MGTVTRAYSAPTDSNLPRLPGVPRLRLRTPVVLVPPSVKMPTKRSIGMNPPIQKLSAGRCSVAQPRVRATFNRMGGVSKEPCDRRLTHWVFVALDNPGMSGGIGRISAPHSRALYQWQFTGEKVRDSLLFSRGMRPDALRDRSRIRKPRRRDALPCTGSFDRDRDPPRGPHPEPGPRGRPSRPATHRGQGNRLGPPAETPRTRGSSGVIARLSVPGRRVVGL